MRVMLLWGIQSTTLLGVPPFSFKRPPRQSQPPNERMEKGDICVPSFKTRTTDWRLPIPFWRVSILFLRLRLSWCFTDMGGTPKKVVHWVSTSFDWGWCPKHHLRKFLRNNLAMQKITSRNVRFTQTFFFAEMSKTNERRQKLLPKFMPISFFRRVSRF